jgi:hypothetical protein
MAYEQRTALQQRTAFPNLRSSADPRFESLPDPEFSEVVSRALGMPAEVAENFFANLGRTLSQHGPRILAGAGQGALTGAAAGPWGALGGGLLGGISAALSGGGGAAPGPAVSPAPPRPGAPAMPVAPGAGGAPAAGAVLQLLRNPDLQRSLLSVFMGPGVGRQTTTVAGETVSSAAFVELLREAADQALYQYEAAGGYAPVGEDLPDYLERERRSGGDTGNALIRGVALAKLLDQPYYVPVPAAPPATTVVYPPPPSGAVPPSTPGAYPSPAPGAYPTAPAAPSPGGFEPIPQYGTPDLGIGQPIPVQSEVLGRPLSQDAFNESMADIFELDGGQS